MRLPLLYQRRSRSCAVLVSALLVSLWHLAYAAPSRYRIFDNTKSPRHHYALAWGLPGQALDWERLDRDEHYLDALNLDHAANYIVDLQTHRILTTVQGDHARFGGGHFWTSPKGAHPNHFDLETAWAPHEKMLVAVYGGSWNYIDILAFRLGRRSGVSKLRTPILQTSIGADVESYVRHYLARTQPKLYAHDKDRIAIDASNAKLSDNNHLTLDVEAQVPKAEGLDFTGQLELALYPGRNIIRTQLIGIKSKS